jgi:predicted DNA-binding protein
MRAARLLLYTALYMAATRTQVYLTREQRERLDVLGRRERKPLAELVREAVDEYLEHSVPDAAGALDATFGALPDLDVPSRDEWDRG